MAVRSGHRILLLTKVSEMKALLFLLLLVVVGVGADAVLFNGAYSQAVWRTLSQYTLELRGPADRPETPPENRPAPAPAP